MDKKTLASGDLWSALVLVALGVYIIVESRGWPYSGPDGPGAGFFPLWYGIVMVVLSCALVFFSLREKPGEGRVDWSGVRRVGITWLALAVTVALLKVLGFIFSFALLTFVVIRFLYFQSLARAATMAVLYAVGFYLVFDFALGIELPVGRFGF
jgi:putative tricarboxylic transport membrane protein